MGYAANAVEQGGCPGEQKGMEGSFLASAVEVAASWRSPSVRPIEWGKSQPIEGVFCLISGGRTILSFIVKPVESFQIESSVTRVSILSVLAKL